MVTACFRGRLMKVCLIPAAQFFVNVALVFVWQVLLAPVDLAHGFSIVTAVLVKWPWAAAPLYSTINTVKSAFA
ncbi:uncharacterized protein V6R79_014938 [Siganus canaliculatus]